MSEAPTDPEKPNGFERIFDSKPIRISITVGAFVTAVILLGFKDDITKSWPLLGPWPGFDGQVVWAAVIYWVGSLTLLGVGICQYIAAEQKTSRTDRNRGAEKVELNNALRSLKTRLQELKDELQTLPGGPSFREHFALRADDLQLLLTAALAGSSDRVDLESGLRSLVGGMAELASLYGPTGANACYAYVMRFEAAPLAAECQLVHMVVGGPFDSKNGLLLTEMELAAKMDGNKDIRVQAFALAPVPAEKLDSLPSVFAPQAVFAQKDIEGVAAVDVYLDVSDETSPEVSDFAKAYKAHPWAFGQSFISLPLCVSSKTKRKERIGVVTITSDGPNIMGGVEERWEIFWMMMRPYSDGIAILLKLLIKLRSRA